jgi:hypothetical protein
VSENDGEFHEKSYDAVLAKILAEQRATNVQLEALNKRWETYDKRLAKVEGKQNKIAGALGLLALLGGCWEMIRGLAGKH